MLASSLIGRRHEPGKKRSGQSCWATSSCSCRWWLNAHAGAKYGIPFPVFVRASFGVKGANIPAVLRALVACGWFGIQSWIGGTAIAQMLNVMAPRTVQMPWVTGVCFLCFLGAGICMWCVARRGVDPLPAELLGALHDRDVAAAARFHSARAGGVGPLLAAPSQFQNSGDFARFFFPALTAWLVTGPPCR